MPSPSTSIGQIRPGRPGGILRLSQGSYDASIVKRNTANRVLDMDLDGFFDTVTLAFFKAVADGQFWLSKRHEVIDVAVRPPGAGKLAALAAETVFLRRMCGLIRQKNVAAISANDPYLSGINALLLSRWAGIPYVIEIVSDYDLSYRAAGRRTMPSLPSRSAEKMVEHFVLRHADAVYGDRGYYVKYAAANGVPPERLRSVRCVTDPFYYSARPVKSLDCFYAAQGRPVLFFAGRLSAEKYPFDLIDVLVRVRARGSDALLIIAGDGPLRSEVEQHAAKLNVREHVVLLGNLGSQDLFDVMSGADVLLATHAGYALIELGLSATPIVAYDYEWHPEIVRHGETGLLAPYRDVESMAAAAETILSQPAYGRRLGEAARAFCLREHAPSDQRDDERKIFEEVFARRAPRQR